MKMAVTQLIIGLSEKFFRLHDPQTPLYLKHINISYLRKGPDRMGPMLNMFPFGGPFGNAAWDREEKKENGLYKVLNLC